MGCARTSRPTTRPTWRWPRASTANCSPATPASRARRARAARSGCCDNRQPPSRRPVPGFEGAFGVHQFVPSRPPGVLSRLNKHSSIRPCGHDRTRQDNEIWIAPRRSPVRARLAPFHGSPLPQGFRAGARLTVCVSLHVTGPRRVHEFRGRLSRLDPLLAGREDRRDECMDCLRDPLSG